MPDKMRKAERLSEVVEECDEVGEEYARGEHRQDAVDGDA